MKKTIFYLSLAVLAVSCVKEQNPDAQAPEKTLAPMEFVTSVEDITKTHLDDDGQTILWYENDEVAIFDGTDAKKKFMPQSAGADVVLSGEADPEAEVYYAVYPYSGSMADGVFTATVPAQQNVIEGSMANKCAVIVAKAEGTKLQFKNMCSLVKFTLSVDGVKSLTLIGNNNEKIAGKFTFEWNDGNPAIISNTAPQVTVSLRNSNGEDLVQGDYYFTILPTNFEKGFSVILGMNDGTQQIVKRNAAVELQKNQIFRTLAVPAGAYKSYVSNFVKYNDGLSFTYGNLTISKETVGEYATYVNDGRPVISADGIYFVDSEAQNVSTTILKCKNFVVAGDNPSYRSLVSVGKSLQPTDSEKTTYIVLSDLNVSSTLDDLINQANSNCYTKFGSVVVNNCKVDVVKRALFRAITGAATLDSFVLENSDILVDGSRTESYIFNGGNIAHTVTNLQLHNNVFHNTRWPEETRTLTRFQLANASKSTVGNVVMTNNTLSGTYLTIPNKNAPFIHFYTVNGPCTIENNFYVDTQPADNAYTVIIRADDGTKPSSMTMKNNISWVDGATATLGVGNCGGNIIRVFSEYPLSADWDPANGVFGYKSGLMFDKVGQSPVDEGEVKASYGAQRTTSAAALNRAGYNYTSEDLGTL